VCEREGERERGREGEKEIQREKESAREIERTFLTPTVMTRLLHVSRFWPCLSICAD
jgi:hypothetical protein